MARKVLGILGGLAVGALIITATETVAGLLYPLPRSADPGNLENYRLYISQLPQGAFVVVLCGHALASIVAGMVSTLIARRIALWPAVAAGALLCLGGAINIIALPHPSWFIGLDLACYVPLAWLGGRVVAASGAASGAGPVGV